MDVLLPIAIVVIVALLVLKRLAGNAAPAASDSHAYRRKDSLFTPAERSFAGVLDQVLDDGYRVYGKVRVADLIEPVPNRDRRRWQQAFNRINAKHFDFVICNSNDLAPVAVIELDDKSHQKSKRQQRDEMLEGICEQVKLPLVRVPAQKGYKLAEVEEYLLPLRAAATASASESPELAVSPLRAYKNDRIGASET